MTAKPPNTATLTPDIQIETSDRVFFDSIRDSKGNLVPKNGVTYDPILELKGRADTGRMLYIRDRFYTISDVETLASGIWIKSLNFSNQEFKPFSLNVIEKDPPQDRSTPYDFVWATETPIIKVVTGKDGPINDDDDYTGDSLEFTGNAPPGMEVEAFNDGTTTGKKINVNPDGFFKLTLDGLTDGTYKIKIKAANGKESDVFNFRVGLGIKLILDKVYDSHDKLIPEGDTTYDVRATVHGYAWIGEEVQLLNFDAPVDGAIGTAQEPDGHWIIEFELSAPNSYSLTAKALYGEGETSKPPYLFYAAVDVKLSLDDVLEYEGGPPVDEGETTAKKRLFIFGHALPGESIQLLNNGDPIDGAIAIADLEFGIWKFLLDVTDGDYSLTAQANYGDNEVTDPPRTFKVRSIIQPHNTRAFDVDGLIEDNGTTPYNYVIVRGDAAPLAAIKLKINGITDLTPEPTDDMGKWAKLVQDLDYGTTYQFIAVADYGEYAESDPWTINPEAPTIVPILDEVTDLEGNKVGGSGGGTTLHTKLIFTGQAKPHGTVEILNGASSLGEATADEKGDFRKVILGLPETAYNIKIRGLYAGNPESTQRWTFSIEQAVRPTIGRIFDSTSDIYPDGYTYETTVTVEGRAHRLQKVQIFDGDNFLREVPVEGNNTFKAELRGLRFKNYDLRIRPLYGSDVPYSAAHGFSIITKGELILDNVTTPNGAEIPNNGSVFQDTIITFNGRGAPPNTYVDLRRADDDNWRGRRLAEDDGTFHVLTGRHPVGGPYRFFLKGIDGRISKDWFISIR